LGILRKYVRLFRHIPVDAICTLDGCFVASRCQRRNRR
jgi:hypothetical protein